MFSDAMESGFSVCEEVVIGDLTQVKEEKQLVPAAKRVKMRVKKAESQASKDNAYRWINLQLQIVDGVDDAGAYKGKVVFGKVCYYADMAKYGEKEFFKKKQHLIQLRYLLEALGLDLATVKINDAFMQGIANQIVLADITQTKGDEEYGPDNEVKNFRAVPAESMV
jgi:hypothetical protein